MKKLNIHRLKNLIFISAVFTGLFISSCEDIVNLEPYNQISETAAFSTADLVELSVTGMYNAAQIGYAIRGTSGTLRGYPFGAAFVQQGDTRGEDAVNMQAFFRFTYIGTYDATTENNKWIWTDTYRLINRINIIISGVRTAAENGVITQEQADEYEGEARLLRAASYHLLLVNFARP
jgi:starch-binding outer membrane protein, SusD/RagB family